MAVHQEVTPAVRLAKKFYKDMLPWALSILFILRF
jgi:hypothetical protein